MSLLISSKSFFFLIYSGKPFLILGAAAVNDLSPVTKSAFGLNGMVYRSEIVNSLERDHSAFIANSKLYR